jgi:hypothetical protein
LDWRSASSGRAIPVHYWATLFFVCASFFSSVVSFWFWLGHYNLNVIEAAYVLCGMAAAFFYVARSTRRQTPRPLPQTQTPE